MPTKNSSGPTIEPLRAREAPSAARTGRAVPQKMGSPTPASGPMRPTLTEVMVSSEISSPLAFCSSMAAVTPKTTEETQGWVL